MEERISKIPKLGFLESMARSSMLNEYYDVIRNGAQGTLENPREMVEGDLVVIDYNHQIDILEFEGRVVESKNLYVINKYGEEKLNPPYIFKKDKIINGSAKIIVNNKIQDSNSWNRNKKLKDRATFKLPKAVKEWIESRNLHLDVHASLLHDCNIYLINLDYNGNPFQNSTHINFIYFFSQSNWNRRKFNHRIY